MAVKSAKRPNRTAEPVAPKRREKPGIVLVEFANGAKDFEAVGIAPSDTHIDEADRQAMNAHFRAVERGEAQREFLSFD